MELWGQVSKSGLIWSGSSVFLKPQFSDYKRNTRDYVSCNINSMPEKTKKSRVLLTRILKNVVTVIWSIKLSLPSLIEQKSVYLKWTEFCFISCIFIKKISPALVGTLLFASCSIARFTDSRRYSSFRFSDSSCSISITKQFFYTASNDQVINSFRDLRCFMMYFEIFNKKTNFIRSQYLPESY